jgi:hypothetical protein
VYAAFNAWSDFDHRTFGLVRVILPHAVMSAPYPRHIRAMFGLAQ